LSRWLAGGGLGSVTAPRGHSHGHSWAQYQGLEMAAVGVSEVSRTPCLGCCIQVSPLPVKVSPPFPCNIGHLAPNPGSLRLCPRIPIRPPRWVFGWPAMLALPAALN